MGAQWELLKAVQHSARLKKELVAFGQGPDYEELLTALLEKAAGPGGALDDATVIGVIENFLFQYRLPDGATVADQFVARRADLSPADREMVLAWRHPVEGLFEVRGRDGAAVLLLNLVDDMEYEAYANAGPAVFRGIPRGAFLGTRLVPLAAAPDAWLVSGVMSSYAESRAPQVAQAALGLATGRPDIVFRNPELLALGRQRMRKDRSAFVQFFGADSWLAPPAEAERRLTDYYWLRGGAQRDPSEGTPAVPALTEAMLAADTVGVIYDETDGLNFYADYGRLRDLFADPALLADPRHRGLLDAYLRDDTVAPLPLRRLAADFPGTADTLIGELLHKPTATWDDDGDDLLRRHKPWYDEDKVHPGVTVVGDRLTELLAASQAQDREQAGDRTQGPTAGRPRTGNRAPSPIRRRR